jgi:hypothetical protein
MSGSECAECSKSWQSIHRTTLNWDGLPLNVHEVLHLPGQPLEPWARAFMEPRFGHDFSQVHVHNGAKAAESARATNALVLKILWGRKLICRWVPAGNSLSQLSRLCVRNSA